MRKIRLALGLTLVLGVGPFLPTAAFAQADAVAAADAAPVVAPAPPAAAPVPLDDPAELAARAVTAADQGDWRVLAVALLALAGFLLRNKTPTDGAVGVFLHSKKGALLVSAVSAGIGSAVPALQGGASVRAVVISAVASAVGAFMGWLTPAPAAAKGGAAVAVVVVLMLGGCGAAAGDGLATVIVMGLLAGALAFAVHAIRSKGIPMVVLALATGLAASSGCGASQKQVFYTTTIATVQTLDEGIGVFTKWAVVEEDHIADGAIDACKSKATMTLYMACTNDFTGPRRAPIDKAKTAIRVYQGAKVAGTGAASVDLAGAAKGVVEALGAVGIKVGG